MVQTVRSERTGGTLNKGKETGIEADHTRREFPTQNLKG